MKKRIQSNMDAPLKYISISRNQLMCLAIIAVLFVHCGIKVDEPLRSLINRGYAGVDLFFFLSGFGLYFSCEKDSRCLPFWGKRLKRIYPSYIVCILLTQTIAENGFNWTHLWQDCTFIGYWVKASGWHYYAWFVGAIMGVYLIFPFYYRVFKRYPYGATVHASLVGIFFAGIYSYYYLVLYPNGNNAYIHFLSRTPVFFVGVLTGWLYQKEKEGTPMISRLMLLIILTLPIFGYKLLNILTSVGMSYNQLRNSASIFYPFVLMVPGFAIAAGYLLSLLPSCIRKVMDVIGSSTLEAYCLISVVFVYQPSFEEYFGNKLGCTLMVVTCIAASCVIHYSVTYLMSLLNRKK